MTNHRAALFLVLVTLMVTVVAWSEPQIVFEDPGVVAEGLSPGTEVVWFGVALERRGWARYIRRIDRVVEDADHDGRVELAWDGTFPKRSIWMVIDSRSGRHAIATPEGMPRREEDISLDLIREQGNVVGVVQQGRLYVEAVMVHPGFGVWGMTTGDGAANDGDGVPNGAIQINFADMYPINGSGAPPGAAPVGGVIMIVDPRRMEFGATRITGSGKTTVHQGESVEGVAR